MRTFLPTLIAVALAAAAVHAESPETARGAELLAPFKADLQQALRDGLAESPVEAISACRIQAPEIADSRSREGVRVGRASHRLRNPDNSPPDWVELLLAAYTVDAADRAPRSVTLSDDRAGYVEPIVVQPLCLTCHGEAVAPEVAARLEQLYPEDRAVGYEADDLRGVFWVEFPQSGVNMASGAVAIVEQYFARMRDRDESVADLFHEDARLVGLGSVKQGKAAIREFYSGIIERAGPTPHLVGSLLAAETRVAAEIRIELDGGATIHAVDIFEVEDGLIRSLSYFLASH